MKLISKEKPWSYLLIIVIEIPLCIGLIWGGAALDIANYNPPEGVVGFPFPLCMILAMLLSAAVLGISLIVVVIRIVYLYMKRRKTGNKSQKAT